MKKRIFKVEVDNKEIELAVNSPSLQDQREATKVYNTAFSDAIKAKAIVRAKLDDLLMEQGLWDDKKQMEFTRLQSDILEGEKKLAKGGISLKDARKVAIDMRILRAQLRDLISVKTSLDNHTAEGQADNARFNYLVSSCTVYNDSNKKFFGSYDDYLNKSSDLASVLAAQHLAEMIYGLESNYEEKLPENKFLKQYKFIDSQLRLVNKEGKLVDTEGRLIDEFGRFVNDQGGLVDKDGNALNEDGHYNLQFVPFLDDNGNPVVLEPEKKEIKEHDEQISLAVAPANESLPTTQI